MFHCFFAQNHVSFENTQITHWLRKPIESVGGFPPSPLTSDIRHPPSTIHQVWKTLPHPRSINISAPRFGFGFGVSVSGRVRIRSAELIMTVWVGIWVLVWVSGLGSPKPDMCRGKCECDAVLCTVGTVWHWMLHSGTAGLWDGRTCSTGRWKIIEIPKYLIWH